jgi:hypothetical protein
VLGWDDLLHDPRGPRWSWMWVGVALVGVLGPLIVAAVSGALSIPHNDAWALSRVASTFTHTGRIRFVGWNDMFLIGQVVALAPFGGSVVFQNLGVALTATVALYATYRVAALSLPRTPSILIAATVALMPGWASLATSYMTDIPAFCGALLSVLLGHVALRRDSRPLFVSALVMGLWAFTIREPAIAALLGVVGYAVAAGPHGPRVSRRFVLFASSAVFVVLAVIKHWRAGLPVGQNPPVSLNPAALSHASLVNLPSGWFTLGFLLAPLAFMYARPSRWSRQGWIGAGVSLCLVVLACRHGVHALGNRPAPFVGNYLNFNGEYHDVRVVNHPVIDHPIWVLLAVVGAVGSVLAGGAILEGWRRVDPLTRSFTAFSLAITLVVATVGGVLYDRYLLVLVPGAASAVALSSSHGPSDSRSKALGAVLAMTSGLLIAGTALALFLNANASDRARWDAAQQLVSAGVPASTIDAGLEWDGWHAPEGVVGGNDWSAGAWSLFHSRASPCLVVVQDQEADQVPAGWTLRARYGYRTFGLFGGSNLRVYRTAAVGCP